MNGIQNRVRQIVDFKGMNIIPAVNHIDMMLSIIQDKYL